MIEHPTAETLLNAAFPGRNVRVSSSYSAPTYQLVHGNHTAERPCPRMDWTTPSGKKVFAFVAPKTRWRERGNCLTDFKRVQEEIPESFIEEAQRLLRETT